jgi:nitroreductase
MLSTAEIARAVEQAIRAPSVHNTQPWRWRIGPRSVELHADPNRHLPATDPDRRDLVLSCGAALHHLLVALAALDLRTATERFPDPEDRGHLATVGYRPGDVDRAAARLHPAIAARRTDRRRFSHRPVPRTHVDAMAAAARGSGAQLLTVTGNEQRRRLVVALADAAQRQDRSPGYPAELRMWTHRYAAGRDGVPADHRAAAAPMDSADPSPLRRFARGTLREAPCPPGQRSADDAAELLVITTAGDEPLDRLRAGEACSAVLLTATALGLATTPLSQAVEIDASRQAVAGQVLGVTDDPQLVIRVGWPVPGAPALAATPRRPLRAVLLPPHPSLPLRPTQESP